MTRIILDVASMAGAMFLIASTVPAQKPSPLPQEVDQDRPVTERQERRRFRAVQHYDRRVGDQHPPRLYPGQTRQHWSDLRWTKR